MKKATQKQINKIKTAIKTSKKNKQIGKYGIVGNTGLGMGNLFHISMPYDCNGKVFVEARYKRGKDILESWKRVNIKNADQEKIIKCHYCDKPAVRLDHSWPYCIEMTACKKHLDGWKNSGWIR